MSDSKQRKIGALETLVGTEEYRERMQKTLEEDVSDIAEQLKASSAILHHQGRLANDDEKISCNVLLGLSDVLDEQENRLLAMKEALEYLAQRPVDNVPGATVNFPRRGRGGK